MYACTYPYPYTGCEVLNQTNCASTPATITIDPAPIDAVDEDFTSANTTDPVTINGLTGGKTPSVLGNDELNTDPVVPSEVKLVPVSGDTELTLNADGTITVAAGTPEGTYTLEYRICEVLNPTNCDVATARVEVVVADIVATNDPLPSVNGATGSNNAGNALANDKLNNVQATLDKVEISIVTPAAAIGGQPVPELNLNTGIVSVPAGTPAGNYTIRYSICELLNPTNCDEADITITVMAAPIVAQDNHYGPVTTVDGHPNLGNVLIDDKLNNEPASLTKVRLRVINAADPKVGAVDPLLVPSIDELTGIVSVPAGTPAGEYEIEYEICELLNITNCATATVKVLVNPSPIRALADTYGPVVGIEAHNFGNALSNDSFNGKNAATALTNNQVSIKVLTPAAEQTDANALYKANVPVLNTATGVVTTLPNTPTGRYDIQYEICEVADPTTCDQAWITVWITAANIDPDDDFYSNISSVSGTLDAGNVLDNDKLNQKPTDITKVKIEVISGAAAINGSANVPLLDEATGTVSVPGETPAGEYRISYRICELLNPTNCDHATVLIHVALPQIKALNDTYDPVNSTTGNTSLGNVLTYDVYNVTT